MKGSRKLTNYGAVEGWDRGGGVAEDKRIVDNCGFGDVSGEWNLGRGWLSVGLEKGVECLW